MSSITPKTGTKAYRLGIGVVLSYAEIEKIIAAKPIIAKHYSFGHLSFGQK